MKVSLRTGILFALTGLLCQVISCIPKPQAGATKTRSKVVTDGGLESGFITPPDSVKPSIYWYRMSDNVSKEGVIRDLEAMARIGIGRAFIGNIGYAKEEVPYGEVKLFSQTWWDITEAAILYAHRTTAAGEIYFVTNQGDQPLAFSAAFRVAGKQPEFWDAVTGTLRPLPDFTQQKTATLVPLKLEPFQSGFIVFRAPAYPAAAAAKTGNFPEPTLLSQVSGPWQVSFDASKRGPEKPVVMEKLADWSTHPDENIKYYSGTAIYRNTFRPGRLQKGQRLYLVLGNVKAMARVKVNGIAVGGAWTAPWQVGITGAVKPGENQLEIEVVNTWVNRLIGDSRLPVPARKTWSNVNPYQPNSILEPSGLIGPVTVKAITYAGPVTVPPASSAAY